MAKYYKNFDLNKKLTVKEFVQLFNSDSQLWNLFMTKSFDLTTGKEVDSNTEERLVPRTAHLYSSTDSDLETVEEYLASEDLI